MIKILRNNYEAIKEAKQSIKDEPDNNIKELLLHGKNKQLQLLREIIEEYKVKYALDLHDLDDLDRDIKGTMR